MSTSIFWFRRDLRLTDNMALHHALKQESSVTPLFIFDTDIIDELPKSDARLTFIHDSLSAIDGKLKERGSSLLVKHGKVANVWRELVNEHDITSVYVNSDYEPYALQRDTEIESFLKDNGIAINFFKDQVIFEKDEITKDDGKPYTVYTPYKNKWLSKFKRSDYLPLKDTKFSNLRQFSSGLISLEQMGFERSIIKVKPFDISDLSDYGAERDFPAKDSTSYLSPHLRFGTVGVRQIIDELGESSAVFLSELIWREFFMQILFHFPHVVKNSFKAKYDNIKWRNNSDEFELWKKGETGYPMVDAGMRQLNETGYMHNRVRMVVASFLCKHLLIDWRWGESYFAEKLLDYDLSANNGNWQWAAGTGCDAAPYFRVFNPHTQLEKFDKQLIYVRKWVKDFNELTYAKHMVDHKSARERALKVYKEGLDSYVA